MATRSAARKPAAGITVETNVPGFAEALQRQGVKATHVAKPAKARTQVSSAHTDNFRIAPENPRTLRRDEDIEALAASIRAEGQLQPVICYAAEDAKGHFQITAGGTRLLAARKAGLSMLWYELLAKDDAIRAGLAEQEGHTPWHAADQARAYAAELERINGAGPLVRAAAIKTLANRVGRTPRFVEQRLALAGLWSPIFAALRQDKLSLDQASAWANAPVERQADVWKDFGPRALRLETRGIRDALAKADLAADDRLVKFAGPARYAAAGGMVRQDLFPIDVTGAVNLDAKPAEHFDREAVKRAAKARLDEEAEKYRKQGWGFVLTKAGSVLGAPSGYTVGKPCTTKDQKAKAGVSLSIGYDGKLVVQPNLRKQAEKKAGAGVTQTAAVKDVKAAAERERFDLTCQYAEQIVGRSLYLKPQLALSALLAEMAREVLIEGGPYTGLVSVSAYSAEREAEGLASDAMATRTANEFHDDLNRNKADLTTTIFEMSDGERNRLLCLLVTSVMELRIHNHKPLEQTRARELATIGRLVGAKIDDHVTNAVLAKIDLPLLRQLVGLETSAAQPKPKKRGGSK